MTREYTFEFSNRRTGSDVSFKTCRLLISAIDLDLESDKENKKAYDKMEESATEFFRRNNCATDGKNAAKFSFKRCKDNDTVACAFMPVANLKEEETGAAIDNAMGYLSGFLGIEPTFDDYIRINKEFKEQYNEK